MIGRMWAAVAGLAESPLLWVLAIAGVLIAGGSAVQYVTQRRG